MIDFVRGFFITYFPFLINKRTTALLQYAIFMMICLTTGLRTTNPLNFKSCKNVSKNKRTFLFLCFMDFFSEIAFYFVVRFGFETIVKPRWVCSSCFNLLSGWNTDMCLQAWLFDYVVIVTYARVKQFKNCIPQPSHSQFFQFLC